MEIELKYLLDSADQAEQIFSDEMVAELQDGRERTTQMHAVYYDTEREDLRNARIAYRIRLEGEQYVCTVKWDGSSENGMHRREEVNVPVNDQELISHPTVDILEQSQVWSILRDVTEGRPLVPLMDMRFERRAVRLDSGETICVLSVDRGQIQVKGRTAPINEMEIELYSGKEEGIQRLGDALSDKYGLKPENISKFQRGYMLIHG